MQYFYFLFINCINLHMIFVVKTAAFVSPFITVEFFLFIFIYFPSSFNSRVKLIFLPFEQLVIFSLFIIPMFNMRIWNHYFANSFYNYIEFVPYISVSDHFIKWLSLLESEMDRELCNFCSGKSLFYEFRSLMAMKIQSTFRHELIIFWCLLFYRFFKYCKSFTNCILMNKEPSIIFKNLFSTLII